MTTPAPRAPRRAPIAALCVSALCVSMFASNFALMFAGCAVPDLPRSGGGGNDLGRSDGGPRDLLVNPCGACAPPTPVCDAKNHRCVGCLSDDDCASNAICVMSTCMPGCSARHSQCADAGSCDTDMGVCHGCLRDKDCTDPRLPWCDLPSGRCAPCSARDDRCPNGSWCGPGPDGVPACVPGCKNDFECQVRDGGGASWACCAHACVDTAGSSKACGACGNDCGAEACCGGKCARTASDVKNCGACGRACAAPNAVPSCVNGACGISGCAPGFADCNRNLADGCEVNTGGDVRNCGACGKPCNVPNASPLCVGGACVNGGCNPGFRDCDGQIANGCEVNVGGDPNNCGVCGQSCGALPHAQAGCVSGACAITSCDPGWGNCNRVDADGCEVALGSDAANCGACGKVCPAPPNVVVVCGNGNCATAGCVVGWGDCNNNLADGCEVRFATDPKNCGSCGFQCGQPNAVPGCAGGLCVIGACNAGFADCDRNIPNGCEVNLTTDANNCGACGKACPMGQTCVGGGCAGAAMKCSDVATAWCKAKGWFISPWANAFPNVPGGSIYCTAAANNASADCNLCNTYNQLVWKNTAKDACNSAQVLVPGNIYGGHSPCTCQPNLLNCGTWNMMGCTPD